MKLPIAVVGFGISGKSAIRLLKSMGVRPNQIVTYDDQAAAADYRDAKNMLATFKPATLLVSPGYPLSKPWIQEFAAQGGIVTSELAIAVSQLDTEQMVAVTGSLGKSTVVSLLEAAAASAGIDAFVGGNLGIPLGEYIADVKEGIRSQRANWVVLELSSFQLENCGGLAPEYSAITYLAPNHLERYPSLDAYYACKWELVKRTKSKVFLNSNGGDLKQYAQKFPSEKVVWTESAAAHFRAARLLGKHNQDNIMLAATIASTCGWGEATKKGLLEFRGLPHRMQNLGTHGGALFINDSKATTIESVQSALEGALESHAGDIFLLLGGKDKNLPWGKLKFLKELPRVRPVFFGASAEVIQSQSGVSGPSFASLRDLVSGLPKLVKAGDMVLLSPGGTSHDEFHNFEERGRSFSRWVEEVFSK